MASQIHPPRSKFRKQVTRTWPRMLAYITSRDILTAAKVLTPPELPTLQTGLTVSNKMQHYRRELLTAALIDYFRHPKESREVIAIKFCFCCNQLVLYSGSFHCTCVTNSSRFATYPSTAKLKLRGRH